MRRQDSGSRRRENRTLSPGAPLLTSFHPRSRGSSSRFSASNGDVLTFLLSGGAGAPGGSSGAPLAAESAAPDAWSAWAPGRTSRHRVTVLCKCAAKRKQIPKRLTLGCAGGATAPDRREPPVTRRTVVGGGILPGSARTITVRGRWSALNGRTLRCADLRLREPGW